MQWRKEGWVAEGGREMLEFVNPAEIFIVLSHSCCVVWISNTFFSVR